MFFPSRLPGFTVGAMRVKSHWMFSRLSLSRFMSYLPLLSSRGPAQPICCLHLSAWSASLALPTT